MAGQPASSFTPRQIGILMLRIKSGAIRQALGAVAPKTPGQTQQELHKMLGRTPSLQKWVKVSGVSVQDLERMVRHGK